MEWAEVNKAGVLASLEIVCDRGFTGLLEYWAEGIEIRRTVQEVWRSEDAQAHADGRASLDRMRERITRWIERPESRLRIFFTHGVIRRIESDFADPSHSLRQANR